MHKTISDFPVGNTLFDTDEKHNIFVRYNIFTHELREVDIVRLDGSQQVSIDINLRVVYVKSSQGSGYGYGFVSSEFEKYYILAEKTIKKWREEFK